MLKHYKKYKKNYRLLYLLNIGMMISIKLLSIFEIILVGNILDNLIQYKSMKLLKYNCFCWFVVFAVSFLLQNISEYFSAYLSAKISFGMEQDLIEKIHRAPVLRWSEEDKVEMSQRMDLDVSIICSYILNVPVNNLVHIINIIVVMGILSVVNINILVMLFGVIFIYLLLYSRTRTLMGEAYENFQEQEAAFYSCMNEQIQMNYFIKLHSVKEWFDKRFKSSFQKYHRCRMRLQRISLFFTSCDSMIDACMQIFVYLWAGKKIIEGTLQPGMFVIILGLYDVVIGSVKYFYHLGEIIQNTRSSDNRIKKILSSEEEEYGKRTDSKIREIKLENVSFAFGNKIVIQNFNYKFVQGKIYGLVGINGSGKSTLIHLMLNMYQYQGKILYNGIDSHEYDLPFLRKYLFGVTEQTSIMIPGSIYENITFYGEENENKILKLSHELGMEQVIERFPERWETKINENGNNLSGGEKKLITIFREIKKNTNVLIFDEPTNELDTEKKEQFLNYISANKKEHITVIISHDKGIEKYCDEIILIGDKKGRRKGVMI